MGGMPEDVGYLSLLSLWDQMTEMLRTLCSEPSWVAGQAEEEHFHS